MGQRAMMTVPESPMTTAVNQIASGLMLAAPVAKAQPNLMNPGPAACPRQKGYQLSVIWQHAIPKRRLTADTFDPPPDTEQSSAYQELTVDLALFWLYAHRSNVIEQGGEWDSAYGEIRKRGIKSRVCRCQQEPKYSSRIGKVRQKQRKRKLDCAAERDCLPRIYTCLQGDEG
jgi:hypothetical protein